MKPILFNTEMVRAIPNGRKTATRRVVKPIPPENARLELIGDRRHAMDLSIEIPGPDDHRIYTPPYLPGDILYVRETWAKCQNAESYVYKADFDGYAAEVFLPRMKWHPSIHMPKEAARIFLRVTNVRVERLCDITEADAAKEGLYKGWRLGGRGSLALTARQAFMWLWMSLTKKGPVIYTWALNPWVWVIEFERCEKPKEEA